jgi:hypothetical protein
MTTLIFLGGFAAVFEFMTQINKLISEDSLSRNDALRCFNLMMEFDKVLGLLEFKEDKIPKDISDIVKKKRKCKKK